MQVRISYVVLVVALAMPVRAQERPIPLAELGRQLVIRLGCPGCHTIADLAFTGLGRSGPDLRRIAAKTTPSWALEWVMAPRKLRPTTWMPHFFDTSERAQARAIVAYLWDRSQRVEYPPPPAGDAAHGEELFRSVGCTGCHLRDGGAGRRDEPEPYRLQGPNLIHLGSKVGAAWLFAWLENPRQVAAGTLMPDLRLSDREAADLTAFLMESRAPGPWDAAPASAGEGVAPKARSRKEIEAGRQAIEIYGCYGCHLIAGFEDAGPHAGELASIDGFSGHGMSGLPDFRLSAREVEAIGVAIGGVAVDGVAVGGAARVEGRKLIARYGCRGCHLIEGRGHAVRATIEDPGMLPPNLDREGSRVQPAWLAGYLDDPGRVSLRAWLTVRMPTFGFSEEQIRVLVAYFAALEARELAPSPAVSPSPRSIALGRETFDLMPCGRCHPTSAEAAKASDLDAASLAPPLDVARRRLRYEWIAQWIKDPQSWLPGTRMPTFFMETRPGVFHSPFSGALASPLFAEPKGRMLEHVASEEDLEAFLSDADAVIEAIRDYVWSLGGEAVDP